MPQVLRAGALIFFLIAAVAQNAAAEKTTHVDLELVLAVDVSLSMDREEQRLQRDGYVAAFRDSTVIKAIQSGPTGSIAVTYLEWAGAGSQSVIIPWRIVKSQADAHSFAAELAAKPISRALMTSISQAIKESAQLIRSNSIEGLRRVIDVSGDGPNNSGGPVAAARDSTAKSGIAINGLAIQISQGGAYSYFDLPDLDRYYKDCVIAGPGAFVLSIKNKQEFATAIRQKLLLEIAGLEPTAPPAPKRGTGGQPVVRHIQFKPPSGTYDCLIGEKLWEQYRGNNEW